MSDLGIVRVSLETFGSLLNVDPFPRRSVHDLTASGMVKEINRNRTKRPVNIEYISDDVTGFSCIIPVRRFLHIDNYVDETISSSEMTEPYVLWKVVPSDGTPRGAEIAIGELIHTYLNPEVKDQEILTPVDYEPGYEGPTWETSFSPNLPPATDITDDLDETDGYTLIPDGVIGSSRGAAEQTTITPNIWWAIHTDSVLGIDNQPFYIDLTLKQSRGTKQQTFVAIRLNPPTDMTRQEESFDLVFVEGGKVFFYDWKKGTDDEGVFTVEVQEPNLPTLTWGAPNRIGFLPVPGTGGLEISVNGSSWLYFRPNPEAIMEEEGGAGAGGGIDSEFDYEPFKLTLDPSRGVRIIGSNCQALVNMSPMAFSSAQCLTGVYLGLDEEGNLTKPLAGSSDGLNIVGTADLATVPMGGEGTDPTVVETTRSISAAELNGVPLTAVTDTVVDEIKANKGKVSLTASGPTNMKRLEMKMAADTAAFGTGAWPTTAGGASPGLLPPAYFRTRGLDVKTPAFGISSGVAGSDIGSSVLEFSETFQAPDFFHVEHSLDITFYDDDATIADDLLSEQFGIQMGFNWTTIGGVSLRDSPAFTGVSLGGTRSERAGRETVSLHCEDYMHVLQSTLFFNSPYYDGMEAYNVVSDISERAGIRAVDDSGVEEPRYFLPAGYIFTEPKKRFESQQNLKEAIVEICKMGEKVVYFDEDGVLRFDHIQGGIAFPAAGDVVPDHIFVSDPSGTDDMDLVIEEKKRDKKLDSTVNGIVAYSVDRRSGNFVVHGQEAAGSEDILLFQKRLFVKQPALGSYAATVAWVEMLSERVFKPTKGITFRTVSDEVILPMSFVKVDGEKYRVMTVNRQYSADQNSLMTTVTGLWFGA